MYRKTKCRVKNHGILSDYFSDETGFNQGGILSPFLFISFLSDMVEYLDITQGITLDNETPLTHILWADDLVLFSTTPEGIQKQLNHLFDYCKRWQLIVNTAKTKFMCFKKNSREKVSNSFYFNSEQVEIVEQYKYVGCVFSSRGNVFSAHVKYTHDKARKAMFSMYKYGYYLGNQPPGIFCKLFDSLIKPILQYGAEIWANSVGYKPLETMYLGFLKRLLRVRNQTPNLAVYGEFGSLPIKEQNDIKTLKYYRRLEGMPEKILVKRMYLYLKHMHVLGHATWFSDVQVLVSNFELNNQDNINIDLLKLENSHIRNTIRQRFEKCWQENVENVQTSPKLRTYKL